MEYLKSLGTSFVPPSRSTPVYKDDCMFSFDTAFDEHGLDICLSCFQAFSRGSLNYTLQHSEFFDHKVYLNVKKILKPLEQRQDDHQPLKMVKLEIKEETESDLYDLKTQIYCSSNDSSVEYPNPELPKDIIDTADAILKATSSEKKEEIKSWEQEIQPCHHAFDIIQTPLENLDLSHCQFCDLEENLWICIICGSLGCGRAQFGGVPGNSHALQHHKENEEHHIAVKLGSLSGDSADCYCYTCNDEIKVPELDNLLLTFGIDIRHRVKTEKNLTELQIEQNIKWDFNMTGKDGGVLDPVFGPGLTGFKNLGNSCYMASALQVLFSVPSYKDSFYIEEGMPVDKILNPEDPSRDLETQLFKIGDGLYSGRYSKPDLSTTEIVKFQRGLRPSGFKALIGEGHPEFCSMQQQDAYEFWTYLIEKLEKAKVTGVKDTNPNDSFKFVIENKMKCSNCQGIRLTEELTDNITLPVKDELLSVNEDGTKHYKEVSFEQCFVDGLGNEAIEYNCPQCQGKQTAIKSTGFKSFPDYLVVSPQRIKLDNWVPVKLDVPIKFQESLDITFTKAKGQLPDESLLPETEENEDNKQNEYEFNANGLNSIIGMGFSENAAKRALFNTGNSNAEDAANWLFQHLEDTDLNDTFVVPTASSGSASTKKPYKDEDLQNLMEMGFPEALCHKALVLNQGSVVSGAEWLFNNPDDNGVLEESTETSNSSGNSKKDLIEKLVSNKSNESGDYQLHAVICHKGVSIHSGHYVAFIKKEVEGELRWVLFNDEKVVLADETSIKDIESTGYVYVYAKTL